MLLEITVKELTELIQKQLDNLFFFNPNKEDQILKKGIDSALSRSEYCFSHTTNKYYKKNGKVYFNPFHSGQYSIFLYFLSNSIWSQYPQLRLLADRIYYLNKALNSLDIFYEIKMPDIFFLDHPVGSVIGRAKYSNFFSFSQNCTVGQNKNIYPSLGENVRMMSGSKVLGNCNIGDNVIISANCYIKDTNIPCNSLVFGIFPDLIIKSKDKFYLQKLI